MPIAQKRDLFFLLRRVFFISRDYYGKLAIAILLSILSVAAGLALPLGLRALMNTFLYSRDVRTLNWISALLLGLYVARGFLNFFSVYLLNVTGEYIVADLRMRLFSHLQRLPLLFLASQKLGDLTSRLTVDVTKLRGVVTASLTNGIVQLVRVFGCIAIMFRLNWMLAVITLITTPAAALTSRYFGGHLQTLARILQDRLAATSAKALHSLGMISTVKAFVGEDYETARYREDVNQCFDAGKAVAKSSALFSSVVEFLFVVAIVVLFWVGGRQVMAGHLRGGDLVAFIFYSEIITACVGDLSQTYVAFYAASGASERVFEILDTACEDTRGTKAANLKGLLEVKNVSFAYDTRPILQDISLNVSPGSFVAFVGPSGAGKSTLFKLISRMYLPTSGSIRLDGVDICEMDLYHYRRQVAIVTQEPELFDGSVSDNIRYGRADATEGEIERAARESNAHEFIVELDNGYASQVGERGSCLSVGQKQRIAIARAFLKDSPLLLLDEPTSSLDAVSEVAIYQALLKLAGGRTTFVIAHRIATLLRADCIYVMDGGNLIERGTHEELISRRGVYAKLATLQLQIPRPS